MNSFLLREAEDDIGDDRISRFWNRYRQVLEDARVPENQMAWYVRRIENWIDWDGARLRERTAEHLSAFVDAMCSGAEPGQATLNAWQIRQAIDALQLLSCELLDTEWAPHHDWEPLRKRADRVGLRDDGSDHAVFAEGDVDWNQLTTGNRAPRSSTV